MSLEDLLRQSVDYNSYLEIEKFLKENNVFHVIEEELKERKISSNLKLKQRAKDHIDSCINQIYSFAENIQEEIDSLERELEENVF